MDNKFLIVASGKNCERWVKGCLDSVAGQTYRDFFLFAIDDGSTDNTQNILLKNHIDSNGYKLTSVFSEGKINDRFSKSRGTVACRDGFIKAAPEYFNIIVWLDLDDELMPNALERLNEEYQDPNCWLTYGNYVDATGTVHYNADTLPLDPTKPIREQEFKFMHLRSYRRELYQALTDSDLYPERRKCYPDANMLFCLMELAGHDRIRPISDVLYKYNNHNPNNVTKLFTQEERDFEMNYIRSLPAKNRMP